VLPLLSSTISFRATPRTAPLLRDLLCIESKIVIKVTGEVPPAPLGLLHWTGGLYYAAQQVADAAERESLVIVYAAIVGCLGSKRAIVNQSEPHKIYWGN
jgi:hypothetical protein